MSDTVSLEWAMEEHHVSHGFDIQWHIEDAHFYCVVFIRIAYTGIYLNVQKLQKLSYLHLFTDCLMKIFLQSSEQIFFLYFIVCIINIFESSYM